MDMPKAMKKDTRLKTLENWHNFSNESIVNIQNVSKRI